MSRGDGGRADGKSRSAVRSAPRSRIDGDRRLKVLVDATNLKPGQGGIRTYTIGLIQALAAQPDVALVVATSVGDVAELGPIEIVDVSSRTQGVAARALWREWNLASLARSLRADVVLSPVPELPLGRLPVPSVIVVHDVGPLVAPAFYSLPKKLRYQSFLPRACRAASAVVCVSQATLTGLHAATGTDPHRCEVIGEGPQLLEAGHAGQTSERPFLLYVGSLDPRKNVDTLVAAVVGSDPPLPAQLVIVGPNEGGTSAELNERVAQLGASDRVRHLGFVDPSRLTALYRDATALVLPSIHEGFGLPVLEAMKSGTAVVASDIPPVREVAGDAALYVSSPLDAEAWRAALTRICSDDSLRAELIERGAAAAARFSWAEVGERFADLLHRVAENGELAPSSRPPRRELGAPMSSTARSTATRVSAGTEPAE